ncbi:hypothetical protein ANANG_G00219450, partial [Anguilla anguilla]
AGAGAGRGPATASARCSSSAARGQAAEREPRAHPPPHALGAEALHQVAVARVLRQGRQRQRRRRGRQGPPQQEQGPRQDRGRQAPAALQHVRPLDLRGQPGQRRPRPRHRRRRRRGAGQRRRHGHPPQPRHHDDAGPHGVGRPGPRPLLPAGLQHHQRPHAEGLQDQQRAEVPPALPRPAGAREAVGGGGAGEAKLMKRGSWSTLTLTQARQVCQKGLATLDKSMLKSKSCHQDLAYHYLQVPLGDWNSTLGPSRGSSEIPCRRMRSGSYVKAMGDLEDSEDSEGSPKPSPKSAARRQSYQRATQHSLSEQLPPRNCLPSLSELSTNRSLDNLDSLDCMDGPATSPFQPWDDMDFSQGFGTLGRSSLAGQMQELSAYSESAYRQSGCGPAPMPVLPPLEPLDLPLATCFRSRSQSYVRAIQAGCSQDEDTASADSDTPPPTTTVRTYSSSTTSTCITTSKKAPPPVPPPHHLQALHLGDGAEQHRVGAGHLPGRPRPQERGQQPIGAQQLVGQPDQHASRRPGQGPAPATPACPRPRPRAPPPNSPRDPPQHEILKITTTCARADPLPKRKLSSIGIQVDCNQPAQKQDTPPLARFQSIGVQVEDGWQQSRSNSMASKQEADTDTQDLPAAKPSLRSVGTGSQAADSPPHRLQNNGEGRAPRPLTSRTSSASFSGDAGPRPGPLLPAPAGPLAGERERQRSLRPRPSGRRPAGATDTGS